LTASHDLFFNSFREREHKFEGLEGIKGTALPDQQTQRIYYKPKVDQLTVQKPPEARCRTFPGQFNVDALGGFGLLEFGNCISAILKLDIKDFDYRLHNAGVDDFGIGLLLKKAADRIYCETISQNP